jgi:hypothetical protein
MSQHCGTTTPEHVLVGTNGDDLVIGNVDGTPALFYRDNAEENPRFVQLLVEDRGVPAVGTDLNIRIPMAGSWEQFRVDWENGTAVIAGVAFSPSSKHVSLDGFVPLPPFIRTTTVLARAGSSSHFMGVYNLRDTSWIAFRASAGTLDGQPLRLQRVHARPTAGIGSRMGGVRLDDNNEVTFEVDLFGPGGSKAKINGNPMFVYELGGYNLEFELGDDGLPTAVTVTPPVTQD